MSSTVVTGIAELVTCDGTGPDLLGIQPNAALVVEDGMIAWIGPAADVPSADIKIDVGERVVVPGFVDSHSHLVFAGDRGAEFVARMTGQPYDGGGIGVTVAATRATSDEELRRLLASRIDELRTLGTTTVEVKSGYGLTVADEVRALQIARQFTTETTFLGAHVIPADYARDRAGYVDLVTGPMLQAAAPYARWIDVSVNRIPRTPSSRRRPARSSPLEQRPASVCACTATSSGLVRVFNWRSSSAPQPSITAPIWMTTMSTRWPRSPRPLWRHCFLGLSSVHARRIRTRPGCSLLVFRSHWRRTAIPGPATPVPCRG